MAHVHKPQTATMLIVGECKQTKEVKCYTCRNTARQECTKFTEIWATEFSKSVIDLFYDIMKYATMDSKMQW